MTPKTLPTLPATYGDYSYYIDGTPPQRDDDEGCYRYYIKKTPNAKAIESADTFPRILAANQAAREAIDRMAGVLGKTERVERAIVEPEAKPRRRRKESKS